MNTMKNKTNIIPIEHAQNFRYNKGTHSLNGGEETQTNALDKRTYTVEEVIDMLQIGRTAAYALVKSKQFKAVRIGKAIRISKRLFDQWLDGTEKEI